jgi:hypothetical protein
MPRLASFAEAKARCTARKMQLPEVYHTVQQDLLSSFLRAHNLSSCFAGLQPYILDSTFRFISTGYPIWKTPHKNITMNNGIVPLDTIMDDADAKFIYTSDNRLVAYNTPFIVKSKYPLGDPYYRNYIKSFTQTAGAIVCQPAWDGITQDHFQPTLGPLGETTLHTYP